MSTYASSVRPVSRWVLKKDWLREGRVTCWSTTVGAILKYPQCPLLQMICLMNNFHWRKKPSMSCSLHKSKERLTALKISKKSLGLPASYSHITARLRHNGIECKSQDKGKDNKDAALTSSCYVIPMTYFMYTQNSAQGRQAKKKKRPEIGNVSFFFVSLYVLGRQCKWRWRVQCKRSHTRSCRRLYAY